MMDAEQDAETTFAIEMSEAYPTIKAMYDGGIVTMEKLVGLLQSFYFLGYGAGLRGMVQKIDEMKAQRGQTK